jgi:hypothetical protein
MKARKRETREEGMIGKNEKEWETSKGKRKRVKRYEDRKERRKEERAEKLGNKERNKERIKNTRSG